MPQIEFGLAALVVAALAAAALGGLAAAGVLRGRERRTLAALLDDSPCGCVWATADGLACNGAARRLLGDAPPRTLPELAVALTGEPDGALAADLRALADIGAAFKRDFETPSGRAVQAFGRRVGDRAVLWLDDRTELGRAALEAQRERDGRARLHAVLDVLPVAVWWRAGADAVIVGCNRAYGRIVGAPPPAVIREQIEIGAAVIPEQGRALARRALRSDRPQSESHHIVTGGERRLFDFTETAVATEPEEDGPQIVGFAEDLTELEGLQSMLADHLAANDAVLEKVSVAVAIYGPDRRLRFYNRSYQHLWGLSEEFLESEPLLGEVLDLLRERRLLPEIVDFPAYKRERAAEFTMVFEPKEELWHLPDERAVRVMTHPHPLGGLIYMMEDVSDRLALERSFTTLTAVQQATLNNLYEGVAVFGRDGRLKLHNRSYREIWGLEEGDLEAAPHIAEVLDLVRDRLPAMYDWPASRQRMILAVTEPTARSGRMELVDGRILDYAFVPLPDGQCLVLYLDVTDTARVQRALEERNAALENADLLKSQFISNMSYELRTPLNAINGFSEILESEMFGPLNDRQKGYVSDILSSSRRLASLISDLLDLAAIQGGYMELSPREADVGRMLETLVAEAREAADAAGPTLELTGADAVGAIECDPERLTQALRPLIANAVKFTPEQGQVSISAVREADEVVVRVADTGSGIAQEDRERMFESFVQGRGVGRQTGAGLGLALCKSLIELHGGTVELAPAEDAEPRSDGRTGTCVTCRLPIALKDPTGRMASARRFVLR